jgi:hypothetical protein
MWVTAPRSGSEVTPPPDDPATPKERWTDLPYLSALNEHQHRSTFCGGDAFPRWSMGYPGYAAPETFYGSPFSLDFRTGWHDPILDTETYDLSGISIGKENSWWGFCDKVLNHAKKAADGKSVPSICNVRAGAELCNYLRCVLRNIHFHLPRFFVPFIRKIAVYLEHSIYHLDGTGAFQHIDEICRIEEIDVVQVLPGAGQPSPLHFMDVCKTVQKNGKNLHIGIEPDEFPLALELLDRRGLCISTNAENEADATRLVELAG